MAGCGLATPPPREESFVQPGELLPRFGFRSDIARCKRFILDLQQS
jgi:hypothetical protein